MDRCTGHRDITEIQPQTPYNLTFNSLRPYQSVLASYTLFRTIQIIPLTCKNFKKAKSFGLFHHALAEGGSIVFEHALSPLFDRA